MADLGSSEWFDELELALRAAASSARFEPFGLGQVIERDKGDAICYTILFGAPGGPTVLRDELDRADVVLVEDLAAASAIASGTPAAELLSAGRVKLRGSVEALLRAQDQLAVIGEALGAARR